MLNKKENMNSELMLEMIKSINDKKMEQSLNNIGSSACYTVNQKILILDEKLGCKITYEKFSEVDKQVEIEYIERDFSYSQGDTETSVEISRDKSIEIIRFLMSSHEILVNEIK